jgi:hypothetical protein
MSKDLKKHDLEDRLLEFAVRIIRIADSLQKREIDLKFVLSFMASIKQSVPQSLSATILQPRCALLHNSKFLVRYSIFIRHHFGGFVFYPPFLWRA